MNTITAQELSKFEAYLNSKGLTTREHVSWKHNGIQVHYEGHWMAVVWNKNNQRYTVDRRLHKEVTNFKTK